MKVLSQKQELFCQYYTSGMAIEAAYKKAGYSPVGAGHGNRLFNKAIIQTRIKELYNEQNKELVLQREDLLKELAKIIQTATTERIKIMAIEAYAKLAGFIGEPKTLLKAIEPIFTVLPLPEAAHESLPLHTNNLNSLTYTELPSTVATNREASSEFNEFNEPNESEYSFEPIEGTNKITSQHFYIY